MLQSLKVRKMLEPLANTVHPSPKGLHSLIIKLCTVQAHFFSRHLLEIKRDQACENCFQS